MAVAVEAEVSVAEGAVVDLTDLHDLRSRLPNRVTKNLTLFLLFV